MEQEKIEALFVVIPVVILLIWLILCVFVFDDDPPWHYIVGGILLLICFISPITYGCYKEYQKDHPTTQNLKLKE